MGRYHYLYCDKCKQQSKVIFEIEYGRDFTKEEAKQLKLNPPYRNDYYNKDWNALIDFHIKHRICFDKHKSTIRLITEHEEN